jgi:hypothetical protein
VVGLPRWQTAALAALLVFTHVYVVDTAPHFLNPNQISRVQLTLALVFDHSLSIDKRLVVLGTEDKSTFGGHFYTDKAPGVSFWLAPFAWATTGEGPPATLASYRAVFRRLGVLGLGIPTALAWLLSLRAYREWAGSPSRAAFVVIAGALGTNALVYATHVFGVAPCGVTLFASFLAARRARAAREGTGWGGPLRAALAGGLAATSFVFDPLSGFAVGVVGVYAATGDGRRATRATRALSFAAGALGPLALWMAYNRACFGHPLETGIHHLAEPEWAALYARGFHGFASPTFAGFRGLWLSGRRGMLFLSPFLALALPGWWRMARDSATRADAAASVAVVGAVSLFATMSMDWTGGWSVGSRYLVPAIPFLLVGVAAAVRPSVREPWLSIALGLAASSVVAVAISEVTFASFPNVFENPIASLAWPMLRSGCVTSAYWLDGATRAATTSLVVHVVVALVMLAFFALAGVAAKARTGLIAIVFALLGATLIARTSEPPSTERERSELSARIRGFLDCAPASR